jgi:uncharacterized protein
LIEAGADVNVADDYGNTVLQAAAAKGQTNIAELLIKKGADLNQANYHGNTALLEAVYANHPNVVKLFVENGAQRDWVNAEGYTALGIGTRNKCSAIIDLLKEPFFGSTMCSRPSATRAIVGIKKMLGQQ